MSPTPRTAADLTLTADHEDVLRCSVETGRFYPHAPDDRRSAQYLTKRGLFARVGDREHRVHYYLTPAGRDWLDTHPEAPND